MVLTDENAAVHPSAAAAEAWRLWYTHGHSDPPSHTGNTLELDNLPGDALTDDIGNMLEDPKLIQNSHENAGSEKTETAPETASSQYRRKKNQI